MWKRWTICLLMGHKYNKIPYHEHDDRGTFLRCARCQHENHIGEFVQLPGIGM